MSLLLLALALSMDAFAAALSRGVTARSGSTLRKALVVGGAFGAAQGLMPLLGLGLGKAFASAVRDVDHWVAFALLVLIGIHMIRDGFSAKRREQTNEGREASLAMLAFATSIDAAAAGVTFESFGQPVAVACTVIGVTAFLLSVLGVVLGKAAGEALGPRAQAVGGLVLIALGTRIVIEHLYFGG
jgi:manganese efflux pump family protein